MGVKRSLLSWAPGRAFDPPGWGTLPLVSPAALVLLAQRFVCGSSGARGGRAGHGWGRGQCPAPHSLVLGTLTLRMRV